MVIEVVVNAYVLTEGEGWAEILYELSLRLNYMIHNPSWRQFSLRHPVLIS